MLYYEIGLMMKKLLVRLNTFFAEW